MPTAMALIVGNDTVCNDQLWGKGTAIHRLKVMHVTDVMHVKRRA
jgi:hypothetical protein